ncbi:hypothetical protein HMPREF2626_07330 [Aerococcus sp. HMSC062A02]|nr:hypothetical protein HMPREF2626_07330 [Aerococcus sp. HMSC062A02]
MFPTCESTPKLLLRTRLKRVREDAGEREVLKANHAWTFIKFFLPSPELMINYKDVSNFKGVDEIDERFQGLKLV